MGGLLSRMYILGYGSIPPHPNKVRKLITLDTPHQGSLVANWYTGFIENDYWIEPGLPNCPYCNEPCIEPGLPNSSTSEETDEVFIEALKYDGNYSAPNNQHRQTQLMRCRVASSRELTSSNFVNRYRFPF